MRAPRVDPNHGQAGPELGERAELLDLCTSANVAPGEGGRVDVALFRASVEHLIGTERTERTIAAVESMDAGAQPVDMIRAFVRDPLESAPRF